jgi:hypothetical protein
MTPHMRKLWERELLRRALEHLQPGEGVQLALDAVEVALAAGPPSPEEELQLLYNSGRGGAVLRWLDEYMARTWPARDLAVSLSTESDPDERDRLLREVAARYAGTPQELAAVFGPPPPNLSEYEHG